MCEVWISLNVHQCFQWPQNLGPHGKGSKLKRLYKQEDWSWDPK